MISLIQGLSLGQVFLLLALVMIAVPVVKIILRHQRVAFFFKSDSAVINYVHILTGLYGMLLGLVAVDLWQKQDEAERNANKEANQIRVVLDLANSIPGDHATLEDALGDYVQSVVKKEWPMMIRGQQRELFAASPELDNVRNAMMELEPQNSMQEAAMREILNHYEEVVEARQHRLLDSARTLPDVIEVTLICGAFFTFLCTFFIQSDLMHSQLVLSSISSGYLFLLLYLILVLENPFLGAWRVETIPYDRVLEMLH